ncbi:MAG: DUF1279 domain-containing protein [Deltaproteobacteria bacterium]|nr:DUF1279 domain-containing protein [Deltaproteobacteria bacterium]
MKLRERLRQLRERYDRLVAEYGKVAIVTYFSLYAAVIGGAWVAIEAGWETGTTAEGAGKFAVIYGILKLSQPFRILATIGLTPLVARGVRRVRGAPVALAAPPEEP